MSKYRRSNIDRMLVEEKDFPELYNLVGHQAVARTSKFDFKQDIYAEDLIDPLLWGEGNAWHRLLGQVIAHQVAHGRLPLRFLGCPRCSNKVYERI
jgi:hypothetical protein